MQHNNVTSGDKGEVIYVSVTSGVSDLVDLDVASSKAVFTDGATTVELDIVVPDANDIQFTVPLGDDSPGWLPDGPTPGLWEVSYRLVFSSPARTLTWPNEGHDLIRVEPATTKGYCSTDDILVGDVTVSPERMRLVVEQAAEEIDAEIGHLYTVPVVSTETRVVAYLKMINVKLATGRYFASMQQGSDGEISAYAMSMIKEAHDALARIANGQYNLGDAPVTDPGDGDANRAPGVTNKESDSLTDQFYAFIQAPSGSLMGRPYTRMEIGDGDG
jgi:hypothetical protein